MAFPELRPGDAHRARESFRIIDVREPHEFDGPLGHIPGAELIPLARVQEHAAALDGPLTLLLVCRSGKRSGRACETLQSLGVRSVANLGGGMIAWNRDALPVERTPLGDADALLRSFAKWLAQVGPTPEEQARERVREALAQAGADPDAPDAAAIGRALEAIASRLRQSDPGSGGPADLDLTLAAYHRDLAAF